jgi:hypothetical protein
MIARTPRLLGFTVQAAPLGELFHFQVKKVGASLSPLSPAPSLTLGTAPPILLRGVPLLLQDGSYVTGFIAEYSTLAGSAPAVYQNKVALWNSTVPNLAVGPLVQVEIKENFQTSSVFLPWPIQQTDYCITYQTGPAPNTMCALAAVPLAPPLPASVWISMSIVSLSTEALKIYYNTIPGSAPVASESWMGLYVGSVVPYATGAPPLAQVPIASSQPEGVLTIPWNAQFQNYRNFVVVYCTGPGVNRAAAAITFQVNSS